jgi:hypothetical protein
MFKNVSGISMQIIRTPTETSMLQYKEQVLEALSDENYRYDRYRVPFCLAVICSEKSSHFDHIRGFLRTTDILVPLSDTCVCVVLASTEIADAIKMGENFIHEHDTMDGHNRIYIGVAGIKEKESNSDIVSRAFYSLQKAKESSISTLEDDNILNN